METTTPREHIEEIRRKKFSIGAGEPNTLTEDLHQAVKNLSAELYVKDVHFLMQLIQLYDKYRGGGEVNREEHVIQSSVDIRPSSIINRDLALERSFLSKEFLNDEVPRNCKVMDKLGI
ncbi:hypothetical protein GIB67_025384 [Kingdonia uniflora]|uniref:Uncharacterized protein n=1 Tax=Kingdonia uniflora TaxID=39325 RepID=A0A7J7NCH9_9MAGN|nr:hypothetical protein GIB67_025384 [Kingdonia uniflora]